HFRAGWAVAILLLFGSVLWFSVESTAAKDSLQQSKTASNERPAGHWKTFVLKSGDQLRIPPPEHHLAPSQDERSQIVDRQDRLTPEWKAKVAYWNEGAITHRWSELLLKKIVRYRLPPPRPPC
ncbi:MAG: hypothetical protein WAO55_07765, partial [Candidatus Manganitrophaceae bacterium]